MTPADYVVVGAGLTGAVLARQLANAGRDVLVVEQRKRVGGNIYDYVHSSGIRINAHGPHYFRTSSARIWDFVTQYSAFHEVAAKVLTLGPGGLVPWPVRARYLNDTHGPSWRPGFVGRPRNFEEAVLTRMPVGVYRALIEPYTRKQWGVAGRELCTSLARRVLVRQDDDERLTPHVHQGVPRDGYTALIGRLLSGITVYTNRLFRPSDHARYAKRLLIFTGPIDEYFGCDLGRLGYRAQERKSDFYESVELMQPCVQINNPLQSNGAHIRTIEWKHLLPISTRAQTVGTLCTLEYPYTATRSVEYEYPFPNESNRRLYSVYRARANALNDVIICGRLGEYRYLDMDQAIGRALRIAATILNGGRGVPRRDLAGLLNRE